MEKYKLTIRSAAYADMQEIYNHIAHNLNEPVVAEKIHESIVTGIRSLAELPLRQKLVNAEPYRSYGLRMLRVKNNMIFYIVDQEKAEVHIVRVLYARREWQNFL